VVIAMNSYTRKLLDEAFALDDEMREKCARWDAKRAEREQAQARTQTIYKTTYEPPPAQQQQTSSTMTPEQQKPWDEWLNSRVMHILDTVVEVIGEEVGAEHKQLREEIAGLRADVAILQGIIKGEVAQLKSGKASDAA
jgi:hypothetical protein